jgi:aspartate/methionine/tyrosine aminotransferase
MEVTREYHLNRLQAMVNPDHRAAYYKAYIDNSAVNLSTAENMLLLPFYQEKVFVDLGPVNQDTIRYPMQYIYGTDDFRESIQEFLNHQWNVNVNYQDIYAGSGVIAVLELLALALFNPGDVVLIPAPMWYGFPWSFSQTAAMKFVPFQINNGVNLTPADVELALKNNPAAKLLVMTSPNNPLGINYSKDLLEQIYSIFLSDANRHIISDEIYACSQVKDKNEFVSALSLNAYQKHPNQIHVTWGLSKDFGLAGFRAGFMISKSPKVQTALVGTECKASSAWFSPFVTLNTYMTRKLFLTPDGNPDPKLANEAMSLYKNLLEKQYNVTAQHLTEGMIGYYPGNNGAIFFWIDLSPYLDRVPKSVSAQPALCPALYSHDDPREGRLLNYISQQANVLLVRGQECFNEKPGYFRLCYTAEALDRVTIGIDNMVKALNQLPSAS